MMNKKGFLFKIFRKYMTNFRENKQKKEKSAFFFENLCIKAPFSVIYGIFLVILRRYYDFNR